MGHALRASSRISAHSFSVNYLLIYIYIYIYIYIQTARNINDYENDITASPMAS